MSVYHITYAPELNEVCLYFNGGCQFSCYGCITDWYPYDCHLKEKIRTQSPKNNNLSQEEEVISYLKPLLFKRVIFLGKEPTQDADFLPLAKILKRRFSSYNILLTNGWEYIDDEVIDEVCVSIKAVTPCIFKDFTGKDNPRCVLENFKKYLNSSHIKVRAESLFIPTYIDNDEIEKIAIFLSELNSEISYRIDAYMPSPKGSRFRRPTIAEMEEVKKTALRYLRNVSILHYGVDTKYKVERIF